MDSTSRTPLKTEIKWLLGIFLVAGGIAVGGAIYLIWSVLAASATC